MEKGVAWQNTSIGYGGAWFDNQFNQAKLMVGKQVTKV